MEKSFFSQVGRPTIYNCSLATNTLIVTKFVQITFKISLLAGHVILFAYLITYSFN